MLIGLYGALAIFIRYPDQAPLGVVCFIAMVLGGWGFSSGKEGLYN
jgi:hypothetical protein